MHAVDGVNLDIGAGDSVGLARRIGLRQDHDRPAAAEAHRADRRPHRLRRRRRSRACKGESLRAFRREAQLVFQNPFDALNPRFTIHRAVAEPLLNAGIDRPSMPTGSRTRCRRVHLPDLGAISSATRTSCPAASCSASCWRARWCSTPRFLVADEPVSMLDVSVRAGILNSAARGARALGLTAVYISHDLALVRYVCERTLVMYLGTIVEDGPTAEIVRTRAIPTPRRWSRPCRPRVDQSRAPLPIRGNVPDARKPPSGCRFRDRCPHAFDRCAGKRRRCAQTADGASRGCHLWDADRLDTYAGNSRAMELRESYGFRSHRFVGSDHSACHRPLDKLDFFTAGPFRQDRGSRTCHIRPSRLGGIR